METSQMSKCSWYGTDTYVPLILEMIWQMTARMALAGDIPEARALSLHSQCL
jgi:hypothetical protein